VRDTSELLLEKPSSRARLAVCARPAALKWHGRLETEAPLLTLAASQLALAGLASLCAGERDAVAALRRLLFVSNSGVGKRGAPDLVP
jgi:NADPH-dependent ferric siderophore reductase